MNCEYINISENNIQKLKSIKATPGYCIFVDIVDSVGLKNNGNSLINWAGSIALTFEFATMEKTYEPIKAIGDALMFFIEEDKNVNPTSIFKHFKDISEILNQENSRTINYNGIRTSIVFCDSNVQDYRAYCIRFTKIQTVDYHGKGIDLAARLLKMSGSSTGDILMNDAFYEKIKNEKSNKRMIFGPWPHKIKGYNKILKIYKFIILIQL